MRRFSIAGLQLELSRRINLDIIEEEIRSAKSRFPWLDMIVLPELAGYGPSTSDAIPVPNDTEKRFSLLAEELQTWLLPGSFFERAGDKIYNTAPVVDPSGKVILRYRKMFPFYPYEVGVSAGNEWGVFDVPGVGRFGLSICYDMWFPETTRTLAWMGAEVILHPSMTNTIDRDAELAIARASAVTNQVYFLDFNIAGQLGYGRSAVYGPGGEPIHLAGSGREIIALELDLDHVKRTRERGMHGLGQPLKSFRDSRVAFPPYPLDSRRSHALETLGTLERPGAREPAPEPDAQSSLVVMRPRQGDRS